MATQILLTIDTEIAWRHHAAGLSPDEMLRRSIEPATVGLTHQLDLLGEHGLKAVFFVDPMPALVLGTGAMAAIVAPILAAGQEVQLHLHPNWTGASLTDRRAAAGFELGDYEPATQKALIAQARALLIAAGAPPPIAFRAGGYAANDVTLGALADLGFRFDSSHNGGHAPWPSAIGLPARQIAPVRRAGLFEIPVTVFEDRPGHLRPCQVTAMSLAELSGVIDHAIAHRHPLVTIVGHSFELATRDGLRANRMVARRFAAMCRHLATRAGDTPTAHFAGLEPASTGTADPMPARLGRTARRVASQLVANLIYERRP